MHRLNSPVKIGEHFGPSSWFEQGRSFPYQGGPRAPATRHPRAAEAHSTAKHRNFTGKNDSVALLAHHCIRDACQHSMSMMFERCLFVID